MPKVLSVVDASSDNVSFDEVKSWFNDHMHVDAIDFSDPEPYKVYEKGRWSGIFQATGRGAQKLFERAKPKSITDIAVLTSIYRPGPLAANVDKLYLEAKAGKFYDWGDHRINDLLSDTHGCLIFQEQVMLLAEKIAGFPKEQCDEVRRAIMKRSISGGEAAKKAAQEMRDSFVQGCVKNGYSEDVANGLYDKILYFAGYGFNKCFTGDTEILTYDSRSNMLVNKKIIDIKENDVVVSYDETLCKVITSKALYLHSRGYNDIVEVELISGERIKCTLNHKFRTVETREMLPLWQIQQLGMSIVVDDVKSVLKDQNGSLNTK